MVYCGLPSLSECCSKYLVCSFLPSELERDGCMKAMMNFNNVCVANNLNPQVLFYDDHAIHFNDRVVNILLYYHIKPFILKAGDSGKTQETAIQMMMCQN